MNISDKPGELLDIARRVHMTRIQMAGGQTAIDSDLYCRDVEKLLWHLTCRTANEAIGRNNANGTSKLLEIIDGISGVVAFALAEPDTGDRSIRVTVAPSADAAANISFVMTREEFEAHGIVDVLETIDMRLNKFASGEEPLPPVVQPIPTIVDADDADLCPKCRGTGMSHEFDELACPLCDGTGTASSDTATSKNPN